MIMKNLAKIILFSAAALTAATAFTAGTADARGRLYIARDPETGRIDRYLSVFETNLPADIVEFEYEHGSGNGNDYIIHASGHFNSDSFVVLHGQKQGMNGEIEQDFPYATFPMTYPPNADFGLTASETSPEANKFFEGSIPGTYVYHDKGVLIPSEYAMRRLLISQSYALTGIDNYLAQDEKHAYYDYMFHFISNLHEERPEIADTGYGRSVDVYFNDNGQSKYLNTFIIDGKMENIWRNNEDGSLFLIYSLDGVG